MMQRSQKLPYIIVNFLEPCCSYVGLTRLLLIYYAAAVRAAPPTRRAAAPGDEAHCAKLEGVRPFFPTLCMYRT